DNSPIGFPSRMNAQLDLGFSAPVRQRHQVCNFHLDVVFALLRERRKLEFVRDIGAHSAECVAIYGNSPPVGYGFKVNKDLPAESQTRGLKRSGQNVMPAWAAGEWNNHGVVRLPIDTMFPFPIQRNAFSGVWGTRACLVCCCRYRCQSRRGPESAKKTAA